MGISGKRYVREAPWHDTMQVCVRGHQITAFLQKRPERGRKFCEKCSAKTIDACPACRTPIPGYYHVPGVLRAGVKTPVPNSCGSCGELFPWTVPSEARTIAELVASLESLVDSRSRHSVWALVMRIQMKVNVPVAHAVRARCETLWSFYCAMKGLYEPKVMSAEVLSTSVDRFAAVLRELEQAVKDLQTLLGYSPDDVSLASDYGALREHYLALVTSYETLRVRVGLKPLGWARAEVFSEIPRRSVVDERVYGPGESFDVYLDIKRLVAGAQREVFIVDAYPAEELFELYLEKVPDGVEIRVLVGGKNPGQNFLNVAKKFAAKPGRKIEVRQGLIHDRAFFVDDRGWNLGQSSKDAAVTKPTCFVELTSPKWREVNDECWNAGTKIV